jgi:zinc/manganese transport system substrate-binding protein
MQRMRIGIKSPLAVRLVVLSGLFAAGACATGTSTAGADDDRVEIVATTSIIGDVVSNIVGEAAIVAVILPADTDPHDFEPSPQQVASITDADLVVANGLGLEEGLTEAIEAAASEGIAVMRLAEQLDPLPLIGPQKDDASGAALDPHFWHDPDRMARAIDLIAAELTALDSSVDWKRGASRYRAEVEAAGDESEEILSRVPPDQRILVTSHDSLGYFADRFGFEVISTVVPGGSTLAEPSGRGIADLVDTIDATGVSVILTDASNPAAIADTVAAEAGGEVLVVPIFTDSLGEPGSGADTYLGLIRTNAALVAEALAR